MQNTKQKTVVKRRWMQSAIQTSRRSVGLLRSLTKPALSADPLADLAQAMQDRQKQRLLH